ncbi:MAG: QueT transporter family protein [Clostridiales bacterium]|nr:QueT transporter family protein [Clostridiales bacterium]
MKITVKQLTRGAVVGALYTVLTLLLAPISFGALQFRVSEALTVLPFIMPEAVLGLTVGCFISNIISSSIIDAIFGTLATFLAALVTLKIKKIYLAPLPAVVFNSVIVGAVVTVMTVEFTLINFLMIALSIGISEFIICYAGGIPLLVFIHKISKK